MANDLLKILGQKYVVKILMQLHEQGRVQFSGLAELAEHPASISRALKYMKAVGLIEREVQKDEERSVEYYLTDKGKKIIPMLKSIIELK